MHQKGCLAPMSRAKQIRVLILLLILTPLVFALSMPADPKPDWTRTIIVAVLPYNADGSQAAEEAIDRLRSTDFRPIEDYFKQQARHFGLPLDTPFRFHLLPKTEQAPGLPPRTGLFARLNWAAGLRWWRWMVDAEDVDADIFVVARYQAAVNGEIHLNSVGMHSPRLALVAMDADPRMQERNWVMLAHELLHTVGANDLYHHQSGLPIWPEGYAAPEREPRYPQPAAELMAGRLPIGPNLTKEARNLSETCIGTTTARNIGWFAPQKRCTPSAPFQMQP